MKKKNSKLISIIIVALLLLLANRFFGGETADIGIIGGADGPTAVFVSEENKENDLPSVGENDLPEAPDEDGSYDTKDEVALYIHVYGHLPPNYVTKKEAENAGWSGGALDKVLPGKAIGGDRFGNYEGLLPDAAGRKWTECDIGTVGKSSRGAKRILFSNDGLIYYTDDHYESFELLYGEP